MPMQKVGLGMHQNRMVCATYVIFPWWPMELDVLSYEHADADTRHVEGVQEFMDIKQPVHAHPRGQIPLESRNTHSHGRDHISMPMVDVLYRQFMFKFCRATYA